MWDEHHLAVLVAKVVRPDRAPDPPRCATWRGRQRARLPRPPGDRARLRRRARGPLPTPADRAPGGPDAARAARGRAPSGAGADPPLGLHLASATTWRPRVGAPRRQARQRRDGFPAAAHRPQRRAHAGTRRRWRGRPGPTPTWRRSSAVPRRVATTSARPPTSGASARRCTTRSPAHRRSAPRGRPARGRARGALPPARPRARAAARGALRARSPPSSPPAWRTRPTARPRRRSPRGWSRWSRPCRRARAAAALTAATPGARSRPAMRRRARAARPRVERVAVGDRGHALGQVPAWRRRSPGPTRADDAPDLVEVVDLHAAGGEQRRPDPGRRRPPAAAGRTAPRCG